MDIELHIRSTAMGRISVTTTTRREGLVVSRSYNIFRDDDQVVVDTKVAHLTHRGAVDAVRWALRQGVLF